MSNKNSINWTAIDWTAYELRVQALIAEGMDRSDAEAVIDAELLQTETQSTS
jgi:hypothetical protein